MAIFDLSDGVRFDVDELERTLTALKHATLKLEQNIFDLDREILIEEQRTRVSDPDDCKYSGLAKDQRQRRENVASTLEIFRERERAAALRLDQLSRNAKGVGVAV